MSQEIEAVIQIYNYEIKLGDCSISNLVANEQLQDIHLKGSVVRTVWISRDKCGPVQWTTPLSQEIQVDVLIQLYN